MEVPDRQVVHGRFCLLCALRCPSPSIPPSPVHPTEPLILHVRLAIPRSPGNLRHRTPQRQARRGLRRAARGRRGRRRRGLHAEQARQGRKGHGAVGSTKWPLDPCEPSAVGIESEPSEVERVSFFRGQQDRVTLPETNHGYG